MLQYYAHRRDLYLGYALKICGCPDLAEDLVQDMFIKIHGILRDDPEKELKDSFIYFVIRSIFIDGIRKTSAGPEFYAINELDYIEDESRDHIDKVNEVLSEMPFFEREIVIGSFEHSPNEFSEILSTRRETIWRWKKKFIKIFKKKWENHEEPEIRCTA